MLWLWVSLALASDATRLGWVHLGQGETSKAMLDAKRALTDDPDSLEAHRIYATSALRNYRERDAVTSMYETWHAEEPQSAAARLGLATSLQALRPDGWCERVSTLLDEPSSDPSEAYQQLRVLLSAARSCDALDPDDITQQILEAARAEGATGSVVGWAYQQRLKEGVTAESVADLTTTLEANPGRIDSIARHVWADKGRHAKAARGIVLTEAARYAESDDLGLRWLAHEVFTEAGDPRAQELGEALHKEDPRSGDEEWTPLMQEIYDANRKPTHELGLAALDALDVDPGDPAYSLLLELRAERLEGLGDEDGAYANTKRMAQHAPDSPRLVNQWAWSAALRGEDLEEALAAMDRVLALDPPVWSAEEPHDRWAEAMRRGRAGRIDTRGWLLYRLGRLEEARDAIREALRLADSPVVHEHLAFVLRDLDDRAAAFAHASTALIAYEEDDRDEEFDALVSELWQTHGRWHPHGLDGWVEQQRATRDAEDDDEEEPDGEEHPLVGQAFPLDVVDALRGGAIELTDLEGPLVVDVWATWCGPCVSGMPHLQEVASAYAERNVRVVGLSVDDKKAPAIAFFRGAGEMSYDLAWIGGKGWDVLQLTGIPALFVIDADGTVIEQIQGYGGANDTRLEMALDAALAPG